MRRRFNAVKQTMRTRALRLLLLLCGIGLLSGLYSSPGLFAQTPSPQQSQPKPPDPWPGAKKDWPKPPDWLEGANKRLEKMKETTRPGADVDKLLTRATDVLGLAKAAKTTKDDPFRYGRYLAAASALMDAADRILWISKADPKPEEHDFWGAGFILQGCYFRVRQADYFADTSGVKKSGQYVELARRLYQQGRSAYDAKEYSRARLYGDASTSVVVALECLAQAAMPDPHIYK